MRRYLKTTIIAVAAVFASLVMAEIVFVDNLALCKEAQKEKQLDKRIQNNWTNEYSCTRDVSS